MGFSLQCSTGCLIGYRDSTESSHTSSIHIFRSNERSTEILVPIYAQLGFCTATNVGRVVGRPGIEKRRIGVAISNFQTLDNGNVYVIESVKQFRIKKSSLPYNKFHDLFVD
jgi:hypothetical protein